MNFHSDMMNFYMVRCSKEPQSSFKPEDNEAVFNNRSCTLRDRKGNHFMEMTKVPVSHGKIPDPNITKGLLCRTKGGEFRVKGNSLAISLFGVPHQRHPACSTTDVSAVIEESINLWLINSIDM